MNNILTTITPYWGRPEALKVWLKAIEKAHHPQVRHILFFIGENSRGISPRYPLHVVHCEAPKNSPRLSIGYYHNMGAELANSEWIMKLDVDALPNAGFFPHLIHRLQHAEEREWFNVGMFYVNKHTTESMLGPQNDVLTEDAYSYIVKRIGLSTGMTYRLPAATNFVCRRDTYLKLGGCDPRFKGWGWEDYQQIYMLEKHQQGKDPLPGDITQDNVTMRCRDSISRPKARHLFERDPLLALLHRWHDNRPDPLYKNPLVTNQNKLVLLDYILKSRQASSTPSLTRSLANP